VLVWLAVYGLYLSRRPAATVRLEATLQSTGDRRSTATVIADGNGLVRLAPTDGRALDLIESSSHASVVLPVPRSACARLADAAGCRGGVLATVAPVFVSWAGEAGPVTVTRGAVDHARVTLLAPDTVGVASSGTTPTRACMSPPAQADRLQVQLPTGTRQVPIDLLHTRVTCVTGLHVDVAHGNSLPGHDAFLVEGVANLDLHVTAKTLTLTGPKRGAVFVAGRHDLDEGTLVVEGQRPVSARIAGGRMSDVSVAIPSARATSVRQAGAELVPTNLEKHQTLVRTAFFSTAGLLVALITLAGKIANWTGKRQAEQGSER